MLIVALIILILGIIFADFLKRRISIVAPAILFLVLSLTCEFICFNYESLKSFTYEPITDFAIASTAEQAPDGKYIFKSKTDFIEISNLNRVVKNIHISTDNLYHSVKILAIDSSNANFYTAGTVPVSSNAKSTRYIPTHFAGDVSRIRLSIPDLGKNETITLSDISLNVHREFCFSFLRVLIIFFLVSFIYYFIVCKDFWKIKYNPDSQKQKSFTFALAVVLAVIFLIIPFGNSSFIAPRWKHHNQYNELAESFLSGQLSLKEEVPSTLLEMENPYDRTERAKVLSKAGIPTASQPWDVAYYNGNYYVYFGVLPVLLFYLPCNALGISFPNFLGVVIFSWVLIAGVFLLYGEFIRHYKKNVPYLLYLLLSLSTILSGGIIYMIKRPDFYSIPIMGALAFTLMGFYFWLSAKRRETGELSPSRLMIGSVFMASVIALRPNLIFFSCGAFVIFWNSVFRDRELLAFRSRVTGKSLSPLKNTLLFCAPYLIIGSLIMLYNAMRFSSPFDFGAAYNLTVSDMTTRGFSAERWNLGVFEYLFRPPTITSEFPFLAPSVPKTTFVGYTSRENMYGGIFVTHSILWSLFAIYKIRKTKPFKFSVFLLATAFITCLIDIQAGGIYPRYVSDFSVFFVMAATLVLFILYEEHPKFTSKFVALSLLSMIFYDTLLVIGSGASNTADLREYLYSTPFAELVFHL